MDKLLRSDGVFHEKGVDVQIAVDMIVVAYENICSKLVIVSSDTDLIPAIKQARIKNKYVEYIGFSHKLSHAMINNCNSYKLLDKSALQTFFI